MPNGKLPHIDIAMRHVTAAAIGGLAAYQQRWRERARPARDS
jgi:hypothetical protein